MTQHTLVRNRVAALHSLSSYCSPSRLLKGKQIRRDYTVCTRQGNITLEQDGHRPQHISPAPAHRFEHVGKKNNTSSPNINYCQHHLEEVANHHKQTRAHNPVRVGYTTRAKAPTSEMISWCGPDDSGRLFSAECAGLSNTTHDT